MNVRFSVALLSASMIMVVGCGTEDLAERQEEVAALGSEVMPFDLEATTHVFEKLEDGGLQAVVSDQDDPDQITLIREHLSEEAERFADAMLGNTLVTHQSGPEGRLVRHLLIEEGMDIRSELYLAILLDRGRDGAAAVGFLRYLRTPEAHAVIARFGYRVP